MVPNRLGVYLIEAKKTPALGTTLYLAGRTSVGYSHMPRLCFTVSGLVLMPSI